MPAVALVEGMTPLPSLVIDACAAPGNKTTCAARARIVLCLFVCQFVS